MLWLFGIFVILARTTCANLELGNFEGPVDLDDNGRYDKFGNMDKLPFLSSSNKEDNADEQENFSANGGSKSNVELNDCNLASLKNLVLYFSGETGEILVKCLTPEETNLKATLSEAVNKRRKRSVQFSEDDNRMNNKNKRNSSPMATWFHFHAQDKTIPIQERQDPLEEKKSPAFNPWGGKRMMILRTNFDNQRSIRMPFNSWGGKRSDESFERYNEEKRGRFFNWGGKRVPFNSWGGKRAMATERQRVPFNSWGGKRVSFHSWGGKRNWILEEDKKEIDKKSETDNSDDLDVKRTKFHAWGGKRSDDFYSGLSKRIPEEVIDKRRPLRSWNAKREVIETGDEMEAENLPQKSTPGRRMRFNSWGGKRYSNNPIVDAPESTHGDWKSFLRRFQSWQDKRSGGTISMMNSEASLIPESLAIRQIFFPWGG